MYTENYCLTNVKSEKIITLISENGESFCVTYKLLRLETPAEIFVITAECDGETAGVCVGTDQNKAKNVFALICEHGVMPCVLAETVGEMEF